MMRRDHVVVTEARHRAPAIHEDLQQRLLRDHRVFTRTGGGTPGCVIAGAGAGVSAHGRRCLTGGKPQ